MIACGRSGPPGVSALSALHPSRTLQSSGRRCRPTLSKQEIPYEICWQAPAPAAGARRFQPR